MDFTHLHVASGFSMRYGTAMPEDLVARAAELGQTSLALTDRDGLYGAVRFTQAARTAGLVAVLGVDLALEVAVPRGGRTPVRGGAIVDPRRPRVTVLARGQGAGVPKGTGWAALCRLVTATHLRGERGVPVTSSDLVAAWAHTEDPTAPSRLLTLLGPDSDVGRAVLARHDTHARALLSGWRARLPADGLAVEIVLHGGPEGTPGCRSHAARMLALADAVGVPAVLSAAVRHLTASTVRTVDVLDAARRLVVLDSRHLDRVTDAGHLADTATMHARARAVSPDRARADRLLAMTALLGAECAQDPARDIGIGAVHLPEAAVLGIPEGTHPQAVLTQRCRAEISRCYPGADESTRHTVLRRLEDELAVIEALGYPTYFLTVAEVTDLIRARGIRVAARGSGAGSLVNHLLGISGVDPLRYGLLMERFCTTLRAELPDIDIDVESARRTEIYEAVLARFGGERVTCVSMMDTYKVRHAVRDVGSALGFPPEEIDEIAKAFPHIRARDARNAIADLPELRSRGLDGPRLTEFFELVESLDGLPRHIALHPCGVVLSNSGLLDRTPVEASWLGFPMSQFDKDDVEILGLLKLDILGIRMQSAMAHAVAEVERVTGERVDLDDETQVPHDDPATFELIRTTRTLGMFQIESPGQRELIGKLGPRQFEDLIVDISLFRPGPVKSDMITPYLEARHGWRRRRFIHPSLVPALAETEGVVVFHEQVLQIVATTTGVSLAEADEVRRTMGTPQGQADIEAWWRPAAAARGYRPADRDTIWEVLKSFASFGFCKAHAAAFALPTYHSAWLKTHHTAAFLSGILTHDPGMYPKRLLLDDARSFGIPILGLDVNASSDTYRVEVVQDGSERPGYGIRLSFADVCGMSAAEVARVLAGQPYADLGDFWTRARVSRPVVERLVLAGAFDALHGIAAGESGSGLGRRGQVTRRDLLLHVGDLDRWDRGLPRPPRPPRHPALAGGAGGSGGSGGAGGAGGATQSVRGLAAAQSQAARAVVPAAEQQVQLVLDLGGRPQVVARSGLPELSGAERVRAELEILGLDASAHVMHFYRPLLEALGVTRASELLRTRSRSEIWVAGVKVATQTPPIRSGRRVVFLTLDDASGPVDATFFEDVQGPYAAVVFHSWLMLVRGVLRRTGDRGVSLRATGAFELSGLWDAWQAGGLDAVRHALLMAEDQALARAAAADAVAGNDPRRRVLVHASGFTQSPYADLRPAGLDPLSGRAVSAAAAHGIPLEAPRKLWHASPGSSGH